MQQSESSFVREYHKKLKWAYRLRTITGNRDRYYCRHHRRVTLEIAVRWLDQFDTVYSTRLHIAILAILLGKDVHILDNSHHKVTNLIDTWYSTR